MRALRRACSIAACIALSVTAFATVSTTVTASAAQPSGSTPANTLPSAKPAAFTPNVDDGRVFAIAQTGNTMVIGGSFTSIGGVAHQSVAAFDKNSGAVSSTFAPTVDGDVNAVIPGPTAGTVYIGGTFTHVNGAAAQFLALLNVSDGSIVTSFKPPAFNFGYVNDLVLRGGKLYVAGTFTYADNHLHQGLIAVDPNTGALDASMGIQLTGHHNDSGSGAQAWVGATDIDVTPDGKTMVVIGNFKYANGLLRDQVALIDLSGATAALSTWSTTGYSPYCSNFAFDQYVRGVSFSPDGSFFVVNATGGPHQGTLCDATSRFETNAVPNSTPTWVDETGGDTLWGVTVTSTAVFVGGHSRWENNPYGSDSPRAGAVPYPGMAALDVTTGRPFTWNPGHIPLGVSVFAWYANSDGVWMGYDENYIGNHAYKRQKLAFFPWAGGYTPASTAVNGLPGTLYLGGAANSLTTVNYDGSNAATATSANNQGIDFGNWRGAFRVGNTVYYGYTDKFLYSRTFDGTTFGPAVKVDPYDNPTWANVVPYSGSPALRGMVPNWYGQLPSVTGMTYYQGRVYYTLAGDSRLYSKWFLPDSGVIDENTRIETSSVNFSQADGMFVSGGKLYYASTDGNLRSVAFAGGTVTGTPTVVSGPTIDKVNWTNKALFLGAGKAPNTAPTAAFTSTCSSMTCTFDGSSSTDSDGTVASYAWDFGDGTKGTGANPSHVYSAAGNYTVTLTVTDNDGAISTPVSHGVSPTQAAVKFVAAANAGGGNATSKTVKIPATASAGNTAVLELSQSASATWSGPTGVTGWTKVDAYTNSSLLTTVWVKNLTASDVGASVGFTTSAASHASEDVAVYSGASATNPVAAFAHTGDASGTSHTTPTVSAGSGGYAVSLWSSRASSGLTWTAPASLTTRDASSDTGSLTVQTLIADPNGSSTGTVGGVAATTSVSTRASMWTLVLNVG